MGVELNLENFPTHAGIVLNPRIFRAVAHLKRIKDYLLFSTAVTFKLENK